MGLSNSGLVVPGAHGLGLGSLALAGHYGAVDHAEAVQLVRQAVDSGVVLLDTPDMFAGGRVRSIIRQAVASCRDEVFIVVHGPPAAQSALAGTGRGEIVDDCENALRELGLSHIDLYVLHPADGRTPVEEQMEELAGLVATGKVRNVGISGMDTDRLIRAHSVHPVAAVAVEFSLLRREAELGILPLARRLGAVLLAGRPLGRGILAGRITDTARLDAVDVRRTDPRFSAEALSSVQVLLRTLHEVAADLDTSAGRLSLAWLLLGGTDVIPLPSTRERIHLEMNLSAHRLRLPQEALRRLYEAFPLPVPAGERGEGAAD
ncbi:aldo/keto reductase [Streptomyces phaeolivaceus]|uniref:Aldo/keto reductase n=1 Tax=Streptomyces phaeolivaceus TaxID=2653200 RepID=A0A5P8KAX4_9ACTN|nr:aldo/keto reductase [Streptomyces phaeolivaceus]QFR00474.1 aldo/keto reductase [Streptomyces phaeolivaceus]